MGKNILVTGSSSFLGKSLITQDEENNYFALNNRKVLNSNVQPIKSLNEINDLDIKTLYHFANFQDENENFIFDEEINFISLALNNGIKNILYSNTFWTNVEIYKRKPYVRHKKNIEDYLAKLTIENEIKLCVMMLGDVYGQNDFRNKLIPFLIQNENMKIIKFENHKDAEINLVNVSDIIEFINTVKFKINYEKVDLIGNTKPLYSIIEIFKNVRDKKFQTEYSNLKSDSLGYISTSDRIIDLKISLEDGFKYL